MYNVLCKYKGRAGNYILPYYYSIYYDYYSTIFNIPGAVAESIGQTNDIKLILVTS